MVCLPPRLAGRVYFRHHEGEAPSGDQSQREKDRT
jgi:hypothetical protein